MFIPPTPNNPDEHLMHERSRQAEQDSINNQGQSGRGRRTLTTGDVLVFSGISIVAILALLLFFVVYW